MVARVVDDIDQCDTNDSAQYQSGEGHYDDDASVAKQVMLEPVMRGQLRHGSS